jgi:hypothetical protein
MRSSGEQKRNPEGIPSLSPELRAASYPGCESSNDWPTLKGLEHPNRPTGVLPESDTRVKVGLAVPARRVEVERSFTLRASLDSRGAPGTARPTTEPLGQHAPASARQEPAPCYNPFRVEHASGTQPRVARGSQPWAGRYNPFGIERWRAYVWGRITLQRSSCASLAGREFPECLVRCASLNLQTDPSPRPSPLRKGRGRIIAKYLVIQASWEGRKVI